MQARSSATYVSGVHLDGRKAVVALRSSGASFCEQAPVQVFSPATGQRLAAHGCAILISNLHIQFDPDHDPRSASVANQDCKRD